MLRQQMAYRLREVRKSKGLSLTDLSKIANVDATYIGRVERNEINFSIDTIEKLISVLGVTYEEFFEFVEIESKDQEFTRIINEVKLSPNKKGILEMIEKVLEMTK